MPFGNGWDIFQALETRLVSSSGPAPLNGAVVVHDIMKST